MLMNVKYSKFGVYVVIVLAALSVLYTARAGQENCADLLVEYKTDSAVAESFKSMESTDDGQSRLKAYFDDCLDFLVRSNLFESVKYLIQHRFGDGSKFDKDSGKELSKA